LYNNIGAKIMGLAKVICWIGIGLSVIGGIITMTGGGWGVLLGLLSIAIGSLVAWISSLAVYGFGELIEKVSEIAQNTRPR
jgi:hypothetical protein